MKAKLLPEKQLRRVLEKTCSLKKNCVYFFTFNDGVVVSFSNYLFVQTSKKHAPDEIPGAHEILLLRWELEI
ncbi:hypothetical protein EOM86_06160 [Candidatus Nomurabacteria bacterium]|nr:hypothetical protein [Candidatus Nomurabacteria bacterium]